MEKQHPISFRLSQEAIDNLTWLKDNAGLKRGQAVEQAVKELRERLEDADLRDRVARLEEQMRALNPSPRVPTPESKGE